MEESKKWWESTGVWGGVIAVAAGVATMFGYQFDAALQGDLTEWVVGVAGAVGGALAVWGRIKASKVVE